jgi:hypothetical protein
MGRGNIPFEEVWKMREKKHVCRRFPVAGIAVVSILALTANAFAQGRAVHRIEFQGETLTTVNSDSGGVAQSGPAAAIYRTSACGFQSWIGGIPSWLDQQILFNDGGNGAELRSMNFPMCYDTCHRGGRCPGQGGPEDCDCLAPGFADIIANFQVYDDDPCGAGVAVAGAGGSVTITGADIPDDQIFDGSSNCFNLTITVDPKVIIPHDAWVEANYGHDDGWPLTGRPTLGQGLSPWAGNDDGVDCTTFCDRGPDPILCDNDVDGCDFIQHNADANATVLFKLLPRGGVGNELTLTKGGVRVDLDTFVTDFDPGGANGTKVQAWQSALDSSGYTSATKGTLTPLVIDCSGGEDCGALMGAGSPCNGISATCEAGYIDCGRGDYLLTCNALGACNVSTQDFICGATFIQATDAVGSPGGDAYLWSLAVDVSPSAKGTFTVDLQQPPDNVLLDTDAQFLPLIGVQPGLVTVETGQCCDLSTPGAFVCITDDITANGCALIPGTVFSADKTCADDCGCTDSSQCADGDACTIDTCNPANSQCEHDKVDMTGADCCDSDPLAGDDITGGGALTAHGTDQCLLYACTDGGNRGTSSSTVNDGVPCDDGIDCETAQDTCQADGSCVGSPINSFPCTDDATCALIDGAATCNLVTNTCRCELPELRFDIDPSTKLNPNCFGTGSKVSVDVVYNRVPVAVTGAQFAVLYDPSCLRFNSIVPGGAPFVFEIDEIVDQAAGRIFYAVGVDPFGGVGQITTGVLATISFTKLNNGCGPCGLCFGDHKLLDTILVDDDGQTVQDVEPICSKDILTNEVFTLEVPPDVTTNVDCGAPTASVTWDAATATSTCGIPELTCWGTHQSGKDATEYCSGIGGGEFGQGRTDCCCTATSERCGKVEDHCWSITVSDEQSFDLEVQLSPIIAGDVHRCISFELYSDCVTPPVAWKQEMWFGGVWDFVGHASPKKKLPKGQFVAMSAMDQNHTIRACAEVVGTGTGATNCSATFKGDPFFGGNWLIGGNLDAWKAKLDNPKASYDKINILDFGMFVSAYGSLIDPNTDCPGIGLHADINGDGIVDADDFSFIFNNFLAHSKDCVCPDGVSSGSDIVPTDTEVSVAQLREWGMPELAVADLNGDGVVNMDDMSAFLAGETPTTKSRRTRTGSGLGSR